MAEITIFSDFQFSSVQFSHSVMSNSLWPHESQHTRPPCPSPTPGVLSDSHPSSQWCHPAISSFVIPFSSCPQSLTEWVFSNESTLCIRWPKYWSFSFSIIPSKEIPGLISVILEPPKNKVCHYLCCFHIYCQEVMGPDAMIFVFWMLSFMPTFSLSSSSHQEAF